MATEPYSQPALPAGKRIDVRRFTTVLAVVSNIGGSETITPNGSGSIGGALVPYAGVKETDLSVSQTITANGIYTFDAVAEFAWTSSAGTSTANVDIFLKG